MHMYMYCLYWHANMLHGILVHWYSGIYIRFIHHRQVHMPPRPQEEKPAGAGPVSLPTSPGRPRHTCTRVWIPTPSSPAHPSLPAGPPPTTPPYLLAPRPPPQSATRAHGPGPCSQAGLPAQSTPQSFSAGTAGRQFGSQLGRDCRDAGRQLGSQSGRDCRDCRQAVR